jgi:hypothetical protein
VGDPVLVHCVLCSHLCVFPVSPQEILLPPRFRALSYYRQRIVACVQDTCHQPPVAGMHMHMWPKSQLSLPSKPCQSVSVSRKFGMMLCGVASFLQHHTMVQQQHFGACLRVRDHRLVARCVWLFAVAAPTLHMQLMLCLLKRLPAIDRNGICAVLAEGADTDPRDALDYNSNAIASFVDELNTSSVTICCSGRWPRSTDSQCRLAQCAAQHCCSSCAVLATFLCLEATSKPSVSAQKVSMEQVWVLPWTAHVVVLLCISHRYICCSSMDIFV